MGYIVTGILIICITIYAIAERYFEYKEKVEAKNGKKLKEKL